MERGEYTILIYMPSIEDHTAFQELGKAPQARRGRLARLFKRPLKKPGNITWKGTKFYGSKSRYPDGTFVSTQWFVVLNISILPLGTKRVLYKGIAHGWRRETADYLVVQKLRLDLQQVLKTYLLVLTPLAIACLAAWVGWILFAGSPWSVITALVGFCIPILIAGRLFFLAKPSTKSELPRPPSPEEYITRVVQPDIPVPSIDSKPDIKPLDLLIEKLKPILKWYMKHPDTKPPEWLAVKRSLDDVILMNYETILPYMEKVVYQNSREKRNRFEEQVKGYTNLASSCAWMLGKEWAEKDPAIKASLIHKETVKIGDIPAAALKLLENAAYFPYFLFAYIFTGYYASEDGKDSRYQMTRHLADTYQGMLKGMLIGFLMGLGSAFSFKIPAAAPASPPLPPEPPNMEAEKGISLIGDQVEEKKSPSQDQHDQIKPSPGNQPEQSLPPLTILNNPPGKPDRKGKLLRTGGKILAYGFAGGVLIGIVFTSILWIVRLPKNNPQGVLYPTREPTATLTVTAVEYAQSTPTSTPQDCILWSALTRSDVGTTKCVYGRIVKIYHNDVYFEIIRFSEDAGTFLIWDRKAYFPGIATDMCVKAVGTIQEDASELYMEIAGSTMDPYTGCP
jgi:hypothetical protein